jgi:hypothetical protein
VRNNECRTTRILKLTKFARLKGPKPKNFTSLVCFNSRFDSRRGFQTSLNLTALQPPQTTPDVIRPRTAPLTIGGLSTSFRQHWFETGACIFVAVSNSIVKAPCVVFLGAGASKPLGLMLMREFVFSVKNSSPPDSELFEAVCKQSEDLEYLFEQFAELETKDYLSFQTNPRTIMHGSGLQMAAGRLNSWLREKVFLHYRSIDENNKNLALLANILNPLLEKSSPVVVFTTNYDPAVEVLSRGALKCSLVDGFRLDPLRQEYFWDREVFDKVSFPSGINSLVLFKLHGSTDWVQRGARIVKSVPMFGGEDALHRNVLIFPATRKIAIEDPYFTSYDYLGRCLAKARFCLVVGYSFRDYDALTRFKAAKIENPSMTISILDHNANKLANFLASNGIQSSPNSFAIGVQESEYLSALAGAFLQATI